MLDNFIAVNKSGWWEGGAGRVREEEHQIHSYEA